MPRLLFFLLLPMLTLARAGVIVEYTYYVQEPLEVVVLNFWFVNCPPCREEIPLLNRVAEKYRDHPDVVFLGIALDKASRLWAFLGERPFYYQIVPDGLSIAQLYGVQAYPTHWVIDQEGVARLVERGLRLGVDRRLERTIEELLGKDG